MRYLSIILLLVASSIQAQDFCPECRYTTEVFSAIDTVSVSFASGLNSEGQQQDLAMTIYQPQGDTEINRPLLVFAFGGAFLTGNRFERHAQLACERFAKAGYVTVSIDYRIGFDYLYAILNGPNKEAMRVFFRAMQDLRAAVQYMRYSAVELGNPYRIDTSMVFTGGASSGGITALMTQYVDRPEELAEIADLSAIDLYGGFYASSANGQHATYPWHSKGVINIAGAMPESHWIEPGNVPVLSAHGDQDQTVPYADAAVLNIVLPLANIQFKGSYLLDQRAKQIGVCSHLYTMVGEDHPSNGRSDYYYNNIFHRLLPRMKALLDGKTFCCGMTVTIPGDTLRGVQQPLDPLPLTMDIVGADGNLSYRWCAFPCTEQASTQAFEAHPQPDTVHYYLATAETATCLETDFVSVRIDPFASVSAIETNNIGLYPNPAKAGDIVRFDAVMKEGTTIRLFSANGSLVNAITTSKSVEPAAISTQGLLPGVYVVEVDANAEPLRQRLVVD